MLSYFVFAILIGARLAHACSCLDHFSIEEQVAATPFIFEGRAVQTLTNETSGRHNNSVTTFDVTAVYKGPLVDTINITHRVGSGASCARIFPSSSRSLVFAHLNKSGKYVTSACSKGYGFTDAQIKDLLSTGTDVIRLSRKCYFDFSEAYRNNIFSRGLKLRNPKCMRVKDLYDEKYPEDAEAKYIDGQPVDPFAISWAKFRMGTCHKDGLRSMDTLAQIDSKLRAELSFDIKKLNAYDLRIYADAFSKKHYVSTVREKPYGDLNFENRKKVAAHLYFVAAQKGDVKAMRVLGEGALTCRLGTAQSIEDAHTWLTKAVDLGNIRARRPLAEMHLAGLTAVNDSEAVALELLEMCSAAKGRPQNCSRPYEMLKSALAAK